MAPTPPPRLSPSTWLSRYKLTEQAPPTPAIETCELPPLQLPPPSSGLPLSTSVPSSRSTASTPRLPVQMSYAILLDLDPEKRSQRSERVVCHYDRSHNVEASWHLELDWLAASGSVIESSIKAWRKLVSRHGLSLVEVGTRGVESRNDPFQWERRVRFSVPPPLIREEDALPRL